MLTTPEERAVVVSDSRLFEPAPEVPIRIWYWVTEVPAVHVKVAVEPVSVDHGAGVVSTAATGVMYSV